MVKAIRKFTGCVLLCVLFIILNFIRLIVKQSYKVMNVIIFFYKKSILNQEKLLIYRMGQ